MNALKANFNAFKSTTVFTNLPGSVLLAYEKHIKAVTAKHGGTGRTNIERLGNINRITTMF